MTVNVMQRTYTSLLPDCLNTRLMSRQIGNYGEPKKIEKPKEVKKNPALIIENEQKTPIKLYNEWWEVKKNWVISEEYFG